MPPIDPVNLLRQLVAIDSVNPDLTVSGAGEGAIATFCAEWMTRHGFEVHRLEETPGRPSVVGILRGTGDGRSLMLNGHLDTVPVAGYSGNPFELVERGDQLHGRGTFDMLGGVAAILAATATAGRNRPAGDVLVTLVADEEFGSLGTEEVLRTFTADAAIVAEPTNLQLVVAHRGFAWFEIVLTGVAAHGSMPERGVDAIAHATHVLRALDCLAGRLSAGPGHPLLGHSTVRVSKIHGGTDEATVADECRISVERRMLPGESPDSVEQELHLLLSELAAMIPDFTFTLRRQVARAALQADPEAPLVRILEEHATQILGVAPGRRGEPFWTDAGLIAAAGIPCLLLGVDGAGAHEADEWTTGSSVRALTKILVGTIQDFCIAGPAG
ncbi:M20/M25/M40 family metallo-hydrolase [Homoserinimonas sp. OAct 916]|uniref:M20/M25/M40 family metallo-hydrolase n=1 Tax=Homoserinimonas sp. OAct 916 TaxID=2211450 RepID=UPI001E5E7449|nr:M20/M25/M40 family metallo-hydrolase [Homoserinimonas sp. OAct 916]